MLQLLGKCFKFCCFALLVLVASHLIHINGLKLTHHVGRAVGWLGLDHAAEVVSAKTVDAIDWTKDFTHNLGKSDVISRTQSAPVEKKTKAQTLKEIQDRDRAAMRELLAKPPGR